MQHDSFAMFSRWRPELHPSWGLQMFFILCDISTKTVSALCFCEIPFPDTDKFCPGYSTYWDFYKKTTYPNPWSWATFFPAFSFIIEFGYENPGWEPAHVLDTFWFFLLYFFDFIVWNWISRCNVVLRVWFCRIHRLVLSDFLLFICIGYDRENPKGS